MFKVYPDVEDLLLSARPVSSSPPRAGNYTDETFPLLLTISKFREVIQGLPIKG